MTTAIEWQDLVPLEYYKITVDSTNHNISIFSKNNRIESVNVSKFV